METAADDKVGALEREREQKISELKKKISETEEEYNLKIMRAKGETQVKGANPKKRDLRNEGETEGNVDLRRLPIILRPEYRYILVQILKFADVRSFMRLIRTCKVLFKLANNGFLKCVAQLECSTSETRPDPEVYRYLHFPLLNFNRKMIDYRNFGHLFRPYLRFELKTLDVCLADGGFESYQERLIDILNSLSIKVIYHFRINDLKKVDGFLEQYYVHKCTSTVYDDYSILSKASVLKLENIKFKFRSPNGERKNDIIQFIQNTAAHSIQIEEPVIPIEIVMEMIQKWVAGEKYIEAVLLGLETAPGPLDPNHIPALKAVKTVRRNLRTVTADFARRVLPNNVPGLLKGCQNSFIFVDSQKNMLKVFYDKRRGEYRRQINTVSLQKL